MALVLRVVFDLLEGLTTSKQRVNIAVLADVDSLLQ